MGREKTLLCVLSVVLFLLTFSLNAENIYSFYFEGDAGLGPVCSTFLLLLVISPFETRRGWKAQSWLLLARSAGYALRLRIVDLKFLEMVKGGGWVGRLYSLGSNRLLIAVASSCSVLSYKAN